MSAKTEFTIQDLVSCTRLPDLRTFWGSHGRETVRLLVVETVGQPGSPPALLT